MIIAGHSSTSPPLVVLANIQEPLPQGSRQRGFDFRGDEAGVVQIFEVGLVFDAKASEFHTNQIGERNQFQALDGLMRSKLGHWFEVVGPDFFAGKDQMNRSARRGIAGSDEHVNA